MIPYVCTSLIFVVVAVLKLPTGQSKPLPYLITLFPPLLLALLDPEIFFKALDFAGTYGGKHLSSFFQLLDITIL